MQIPHSGTVDHVLCCVSEEGRVSLSAVGQVERIEFHGVSERFAHVSQTSSLRRSLGDWQRCEGECLNAAQDFCREIAQTR